MMSTTKIQVGSLWRAKNFPDAPVREVLYVDKRTIAYRTADGSGPGVAMSPADFLATYSPVPTPPPEVELRWAIVRPDGGILGVRAARDGAVYDARAYGAVGVVRLVPDMGTWEAVS